MRVPIWAGIVALCLATGGCAGSSSGSSKAAQDAAADRATALARATCARARAGTAFDASVDAAFAVHQLLAVHLNPTPWDRMAAAATVDVCYPAIGPVAGLYVDARGDTTPAPPLPSGTCTTTPYGRQCSVFLRSVGS